MLMGNFSKNKKIAYGTAVIGLRKYNKAGAPRYRPTKESREMVKNMAAMGLCQQR